MTLDKLTVYNGALLRLGQRKLSSTSEDRPPRYYLDHLLDAGAVEFCLETAKPVFARLTTELSSGTVPSTLGFAYEYTLPSDFNSVVGVFHDDKLIEPVSRYVIEGGNLYCDSTDDSVFLRYIDADFATDYTSWSASFAELVETYLASKLAPNFAPDMVDDLSTAFTDMVQAIIALNERDEPSKQPRGKTTTLSADWKKIYNDAILCMGLEEITDLDADSNIRAKIDAAVDADLVQDLLEDIGWLFALTATKSTYDPSIEPFWGYRRAHALPDDLLRLDGIYQDEYMQYPLKAYTQENNTIYCDYDDFYLQYVSSDWLTQSTLWPAFFRKLVAAKIALDCVSSLQGDKQLAIDKYKERKNNAMGNDAVMSPPRKIAQGSWTRGRWVNRYRGRP